MFHENCCIVISKDDQNHIRLETKPSRADPCHSLLVSLTGSYALLISRGGE